jgi:hypothetical protein
VLAVQCHCSHELPSSEQRNDGKLEFEGAGRTAVIVVQRAHAHVRYVQQSTSSHGAAGRLHVAPALATGLKDVLHLTSRPESVTQRPATPRPFSQRDTGQDSKRAQPSTSAPSELHGLVAARSLSRSATGNAASSSSAFWDDLVDCTATVLQFARMHQSMSFAAGRGWTHGGSCFKLGTALLQQQQQRFTVGFSGSACTFALVE